MNKLRVYDPVAKEILGPFTIEDLMLDRYPVGLLTVRDGKYGAELRKDLIWAIDNSITRVEVIYNNVRFYVARDKEVTYSIQDDGRTLKVFVEEKKDD